MRSDPSIRIPVELSNPGQFFACCGLLELADRLWPGAEGWFEDDRFHICSDGSFFGLIESLRRASVNNTMSSGQLARLEELSRMTKKQREAIPGAEEEKKQLESLRRELPIRLTGDVSLRIDWFTDEEAGGSRFKTWAGQQSVLDIARAMHGGVHDPAIVDEATLWANVRGIGLPFFFDSDLGGEGSGLDIGFSFDPLSGSEATRIEGTSRPGLELLAFIGLQRFRPREFSGENRFVYVAWNQPLPPCVAACAVCQVMPMEAPAFEFRLLYRTKYLKSFLPALPFEGDFDEQA